MAKSKSKVTSSKKSVTSKKKKFSFKNLDLKKNWKKLSYLGLIGFLAVSSVGYGIWQRVEEESADAISYASSFRLTKDWTGTCTGTYITLIANTGGQAMSIWAHTGSGWKMIAGQYSPFGARSQLNAADFKIRGVGGSGRVLIRGAFTNNSGVTTYETCYRSV